MLGAWSEERLVAILLTRKRVAGGFLGLAIAVGSGAVGGIGAEMVSGPAAVQASTVGGAITRSEVLDRAQYWVDEGEEYNTSASAPDPDGRSYRTDCSGLVAMAWHLNGSPDTDAFNDVSDARWDEIPLDDLLPGDAVVKPDVGSVSGHIELFVSWKDKSNHRAGAYVYSFNNTGETVRNPYKVNNVGKLGFDSWDELTDYHKAIRYTNIRNDPATTPSFRYLYTLEGGKVYETYGSSTGWVKNPINVPTTATALSATWSLGGQRYLYTLEGGKVYETYGSSTGWVKNSINVPTAATALSATWSPSGRRYIYTLEDGALYETYGSPTGWAKNPINVPTAATAVSATWSPSGERYIYTVENGEVYETYGSPTGWVKNRINVPTAATAVSATWSPSGERYIYTVENGEVYETYG
ncbi:hypothetical protein AB0J86_09870, partial [Micromonospora sp. NPDC049559]